MTSRQREWQQRQQRANKCIICGQPEVVPCYCEHHRSERMRKLRDKRGDDYQAQTCSVCGETGHNKRTCPERPCSICEETGHNERACPKRELREEREATGS